MGRTTLPAWATGAVGFGNPPVPADVAFVNNNVVADHMGQCTTYAAFFGLATSETHTFALLPHLVSKWTRV